VAFSVSGLLRLDELEGAHRVPSSFAKNPPRPSFQYLTLFSEELVLFAQPAELLTLFGARAFALAMIDLCLSDPVA
jgi:hypothetical protein